VVSRQVGGPAAQGLVGRRPGPADARVTLVTVSDAGLRRRDQWRERAKSLLHQRLAGWSDDDFSAAAVVLQRLATDLTATTTPRGHR
jgi:DNA-binding MarR family transcriptional regulator